MVFHGDYEIEFEIYDTREGDVWPKLVGYMTGINAGGAKIRWVEEHHILPQEENKIIALSPAKR